MFSNILQTHNAQSFSYCVYVSCVLCGFRMCSFFFIRDQFPSLLRTYRKNYLSLSSNAQFGLVRRWNLYECSVMALLGRSIYPLVVFIHAHTKPDVCMHVCTNVHVFLWWIYMFIFFIGKYSFVEMKSYRCTGKKLRRVRYRQLCRILRILPITSTNSIMIRRSGWESRILNNAKSPLEAFVSRSEAARRFWRSR